MNGFAYKCVALKEDVLKERKSYCPKIVPAGTVKGLIIIISRHFYSAVSHQQA